MSGGRNRVLFVIGQPGAAAYFRPLWDKWRGSDDAPDWRLCLHAATGSKEDVSLEGPGAQLDWRDGEDFIALLGGWRPGLIITSTTYKRLEGAAVAYAREHGAASMQLIDSHYDYARRLRDTNGPGLLPDRVLLFDDIAVSEAMAEGLPRDRLQTVGNPAWETVTLAHAADETRVLFASQPIAADMGTRLGYNEQTALQLVANARKQRPDLLKQVFLALHPREKASDKPLQPWLTSIASAKLGIDQAATVLGMFSAVLFEAVLAGRRAISLQPDALGFDMCMLSRHGLIPRVRNTDDLIKAISEDPPAIDELRSWYADSLNRLDHSIHAMMA